MKAVRPRKPWVLAGRGAYAAPHAPARKEDTQKKRRGGPIRQGAGWKPWNQFTTICPAKNRRNRRTRQERQERQEKQGNTSSKAQGKGTRAVRPR